MTVKAHTVGASGPLWKWKPPFARFTSRLPGLRRDVTPYSSRPTKANDAAPHETFGAMAPAGAAIRVPVVEPGGPMAVLAPAPFVLANVRDIGNV